jgi:hypothetical protein
MNAPIAYAMSALAALALFAILLSSPDTLPSVTGKALVSAGALVVFVALGGLVLLLRRLAAPRDRVAWGAMLAFNLIPAFGISYKVVGHLNARLDDSPPKVEQAVATKWVVPRGAKAGGSWLEVRGLTNDPVQIDGRYRPTGIGTEDRDVPVLVTMHPGAFGMPWVERILRKAP